MVTSEIPDPPPVLNASTFDALFEQCRARTDEEKWTEINWIGEMWKGRQEAIDRKKPMFIWAMNGHPLGCV
jgi:hypothetical protein